MKNPKSRPKMSEVVDALGDIISEIETCEDDRAQTQNVSVSVETKHVGDGSQRVLSLRNKSSRKFDWRNWSIRLVNS